MNLSDYIKKRNGVPMGASNSMRNMLYRSLGAGTFSKFWNYWNPIWGYYLGKHLFKPLKKVLPPALSLILTFTICGFIHDAAIILLKREFILLLTPWFFFMGLCVVATSYAKVDYSRYNWITRAFINVLIIAACLALAYQVRY